jgi:hypothetical protein
MSFSLACAPDAYSDFREYQVVLAALTLAAF